MAGDASGEKPKIIIDEDWKSQAQAEKERLQAEMERKQRPADHTEAQIPPASFPLLISTLAHQALVFLGQMPNPLTGKAELHLDQAKHFIDTLQVLDEKTKGNLTPDEAAMLEQVLHELRLAYVTLRNQTLSRQSGA